MRTFTRFFVLAFLAVTLGTTGGCTSSRSATVHFAQPLTQTNATPGVISQRHPTVLAPSPLNRYTTKEDIALGARMVSTDAIPRFSQANLVTDAPIQAYLRELFDELLAAAPEYARAFTYQIRLYRDPSGRNAYAVPGGHIFISLEIMSELPSEGALVGILGHEMGHVALRHSTAQMTFEDMFCKKTTLIGWVTNKIGSFLATDEYRLFKVFQEIEKREGIVTPSEHRRQHELEADVFAAQVMSMTRFSAEEFRDWNRERACECDGVKQHHETHPLFTVRARRINQEISLCVVQSEPTSTPIRFSTMRRRAKLLAGGTLVAEPLLLPKPLHRVIHPAPPIELTK